MQNSDRILVTGGTGMLGNAVASWFKDKYDVYATFLNNYVNVRSYRLLRCDLRDKRAVDNLLHETMPKLVIHTAALTDVDYCETHPDEAYNTNVNSTENIVRACKLNKSMLIHISTDFVFDGRKGFYNEEDIPNPINIYGKTKYEAEKIVINSSLEYILIRTSIYGKNIQNKKCFIERVIESLRNNAKLNAFADIYSTPILVNNLARMINRLYDNEARGIFHIGCDERISRYSLAIKTARVFSLNENLIVHVNSSDIALSALRPKDASLDNRKIKLFLGLNNISLEKDIKEMKTIENNAKY